MPVPPPAPHLPVPILSLEDAARASLLFHSARKWTEETQAEWEKLTGMAVVSSLNLCDILRRSLAAAERPVVTETPPALPELLVGRATRGGGGDDTEAVAWPPK